MRHLGKFVLSEGARYQALMPASGELQPRAIPGSTDDGLDGWSFMARTAARDLALLYFENRAVAPKLTGLTAGARYRWTWFNPRTGGWGPTVEMVAPADGTLATPAFPVGDPHIINDWAAKLVRLP